MASFYIICPQLFYSGNVWCHHIGESKENWALLHILLVSECHVDVTCVLFVITYGFGILEVMSGVLC